MYRPNQDQNMFPRLRISNNSAATATENRSADACFVSHYDGSLLIQCVQVQSNTAINLLYSVNSRKPMFVSVHQKAQRCTKSFILCYPYCKLSELLKRATPHIVQICSLNLKLPDFMEAITYSLISTAISEPLFLTFHQPSKYCKCLIMECSGEQLSGIIQQYQR